MESNNSGTINQLADAFHVEAELDWSQVRPDLVDEQYDILLVQNTNALVSNEYDENIIKLYLSREGETIYANAKVCLPQKKVDEFSEIKDYATGSLADGTGDFWFDFHHTETVTAAEGVHKCGDVFHFELDWEVPVFTVPSISSTTAKPKPTTTVDVTLPTTPAASTEPASSPTTTTAATTTTTTVETGNTSKCFDDFCPPGTHHVIDDCTTYCECANGIAFPIKKCPGSTRFSTASKTCVHPHEVNCNAPHRRSRRASINPHTLYFSITKSNEEFTLMLADNASSASFQRSLIDAWIINDVSITAEAQVLNAFAHSGVEDDLSVWDIQKCKSPWSSWSDCSVTCGSGYREKTRFFNQEVVINSEKCEEEECPMEIWMWTNWSSCTVSCGGGSRERNRKEGVDIESETEICNTSKCPSLVNYCNNQLIDDVFVSAVTPDQVVASISQLGRKYEINFVMQTERHGNQELLRFNFENAGWYAENFDQNFFSVELDDGEVLFKLCLPQEMFEPETTEIHQQAQNMNFFFTETVEPAESVHKCGDTITAGNINLHQPIFIKLTKSDDHFTFDLTNGENHVSHRGDLIEPWVLDFIDIRPQEGVFLRQFYIHSGSEDFSIETCRTEWSEWSLCSEICGDGTSTRMRMFSHEEETEEVTCNIEPCVTEWTEWSDCNVECGGGTKTRSRQVGDSTEFQDETCNENSCLQWTTWSVCTVTCGGGTRSRELSDPNETTTPLNLLAGASTTAATASTTAASTTTTAAPSTTKSTTTTITTTTTTKVTTTTAEVGNTSKCFDAFCPPGTHHVIDDCTAYCECANGIAFPIKKCPGSTRFSTASKTCVHPHEVNCNAPHRRSRRETEIEIETCNTATCKTTTATTTSTTTSTTSTTTTTTTSATTTSKSTTTPTSTTTTTTTEVITSAGPTTPTVTNPELTPWSDWSDCSKTCGHGARSRQRFFVDVEQTEYEECVLEDCPVQLTTTLAPPTTTLAPFITTEELASAAQEPVCDEIDFCGQADEKARTWCMQRTSLVTTRTFGFKNGYTGETTNRVYIPELSGHGFDDEWGAFVIQPFGEMEINHATCQAVVYYVKRYNSGWEIRMAERLPYPIPNEYDSVVSYKASNNRPKELAETGTFKMHSSRRCGDFNFNGKVNQYFAGKDHNGDKISNIVFETLIVLPRVSGNGRDDRGNFYLHSNVETVVEGRVAHLNYVKRYENGAEYKVKEKVAWPLINFITIGTYTQTNKQSGKQIKGFHAMRAGTHRDHGLVIEPTKRWIKTTINDEVVLFQDSNYQQYPGVNASGSSQLGLYTVVKPGCNYNTERFIFEWGYCDMKFITPAGLGQQTHGTLEYNCLSTGPNVGFHGSGKTDLCMFTGNNPHLNHCLNEMPTTLLTLTITDQTHKPYKIKIEDFSLYPRANGNTGYSDCNDKFTLRSPDWPLTRRHGQNNWTLKYENGDQTKLRFYYNIRKDGSMTMSGTYIIQKNDGTQQGKFKALGGLGMEYRKKIKESCVVPTPPPVENCHLQCDSGDDKEAKCIRVNRQVQCQCSLGFEDIGGVCMDINECSNQSHDCQSSACINVIGSYECIGQTGLSYEGRLFRLE